MCEGEKASHPRPKIELADIFRLCLNQLPRLPEAAVRAVRDIIRCRTAALAGHVRECGHCGHVEISYNSCRNRHCPKCQSLEQARWVETQRAALLDVEYHHVIFTVPEVLNPLFQGNHLVAYSLLFAAVSQTLLEVAANPRHLGAKIGFTAVLHTWTQTLLYHPHIHCIVPGGGLDGENTRWQCCTPGFFLPVRVLSEVFRGKLLNKLESALGDGTLHDPENRARTVLRKAAEKKWVVYSKPPVAGAERVLQYLGRYTYRIAISNARLISLLDGQVTFTYRDRADNNQRRTMTLDACELTRRFLLHILPRGLVRIRHFGFLANSVRQSRIALCRQLLGIQQTGPPSSPNRTESWQELLLRLTGEDVTLCPKCKVGRLLTKGYLLPQDHTRSPPPQEALP